jgi:hypothetical protein
MFSSFNTFHASSLRHVIKIALSSIPTAPTISDITSTGVTITTNNTDTTLTYTLSGTGLTTSPTLSASGTVAITGLSGSTQYTVRVVATNSSGSTNSSAVTFTTLDPQPIVTSQLIGLYNFNTTPTTTPTISNGFAPRFTAGSGTISTTTKKYGAGALSTINNADNRLYLGAYSVTTNNQISIAFWLYPIRSSLFGNAGTFLINTNNEDRNSQGYFTIIQNVNNNATNNVRLAIFGSGSISTDTFITGDQWSHCCFVYEGQFCSFYLNGTFIQRASFSNNIPTVKTFHPTLCSNSHASGLNQGSSLFIDEFRIYDGLLTQTDVTNIYDWKS